MNQPGSNQSGALTRRMNELLSESGLAELTPEVAAKFEAYLNLLLRWNARTNLTAIRDADGIVQRHFLESIASAGALPVEIASLLDFGSGAGFPGIPIALCRPEIAVTLAESQGKKAAFLREVVRTLGIRAVVHAARAETVGRTFDCVTLRAVDRMDEAAGAAAKLVSEGGWLAPLTTRQEIVRIESLAGPEYRWDAPIGLPGGNERILLIGRRSA